MRDPTKTWWAARERYKGHIQPSLSCISRAVWLTTPTTAIGPRSEHEYRLALSDEPLRLDRTTEEPPVWLTASQQFHFGPDQRYPGEWKLYTDGYVYTITEDESRTEELISWHYHPISRPDTHMHIGKGHPAIGRLHHAHVPSGRVFFEEVVSFWIDELGVRPARDDWSAVLSEKLARLRRFRTW